MYVPVLMSILIILVVSVAYKAIRLYRFKSYFANHARTLGYKVHQHPYCWFGSAMYTQFKTQQAINGDAHYHYKHHLSKCDLIVSNLLLRTMVEIQEPNLIREFFLKANEGYYVKGYFGLGHLRLLIGVQNLLLSEGERWKNRRKVLSTVFNFDFITHKIPKIQAISRKAIETLYNSNQTDQIQCQISETLLQVFSRVILKCFFKGEDINYIGKQRTLDFINRMLIDISNVGRSKKGVFLGVKFATFGLTPQNRRINQEIKQFRKAAKEVVMRRIQEIEEQRAKGHTANKSQDIIEALINSNEMSTGKGNKQLVIDVDNLINEFVTFFLAGSETTFAFTKMMIYRLADNPAIMAKVREEFQREINTDQITLEQLKNLKYFQKVQKETLRMDSSVGAIFTRVATKDHYLNNLKIHKGMTLTVRLRATHYKQSEYINPLIFNPDRWNSNENESTSNPFSYIPFSSGSRNCIGKHLALLQNKILMIELLRKFSQIKIDRPLCEVKMNISTLYGPEPITTILTKAKRQK